MIEYLVRLLSDKYSIAILSRGYKRRSSGFVLASNDTNVSLIGDEPQQFFNKFGNQLPIAVCEKRALGIKKLISKFPKLQIVLLDDAYQHRKVKPDINILITPHHNPFFNDWFLPTGNLRESRNGASRADLVVVSKCPRKLQKDEFESNIGKYTNAPVYFSELSYGDCHSLANKKKITPLHTVDTAIILTGIVNPKPISRHLNIYNIKAQNYSFADHHNYSKLDITKVVNECVAIQNDRNCKVTVVTTEKDATKLIQFKDIFEDASIEVIVLPVKHEFLVNQSGQSFDQIIFDLITTKTTSNR